MQPTFSQKSLPTIILLIISFLIVWNFCGDFFSNYRLMATSGDGLKHYYTLSYFIEHGNGWHFDGMAYPYGEHFMFVDGHGIVGKILHFIHHHIFEISDYSVGILHFLIFSALIISPLFLFKILVHYGFKPWEAIVAALLIFSLSPQWHRISSHQSLAYIIFIPLLWWLIIQILHQSKSLIWAILYGVVAFFFGSIHPYYLPLAAVFALAFAVTSAYENNQFQYRRFITFVIMAFLPLIAFIIFMKITDPYAAERGYVAGGFFLYMGTFEGVFLPNFGRYFDFWQSITGVKIQNIEAFNYVGFVSQIVFISLIINFLKRFIKGQFAKSIRFSDNVELNQFVQAAFLVLLFSFALIFQWFPQLLEHIPTLRQFRSLGRFAWVFYYVFTVFVVFKVRKWLYQLNAKNHKLAIGLAVLSISIWSLESYNNVERHQRLSLKKDTPNYFLTNEFENILDSINRKSTDYQAIIPVPVYHLGSDKLAIVRSSRSLSYAFRASYDLNLPTTAHYSTRSPLKKSFEVLRWISHDLTRFEEDFDLFDERSFLIISANKKLSKADKRLLAKAKVIYESKAYNFYELDIVKYKKEIKEKRENLITVYGNRQDSLVKIKDNLFSNKPTKTVHINTFDNESVDWKTPQPFGNQNYFGRANQHVLYDGKLSTDYDNQQVEISVWTYTNEDLPSMPILKCEIYDDNNELIERKEVLGTLSSETLGRWVRISLIMKISDHRHRIYLGYYNNFRDFNCYVDNFVIRPTGANIWYKQGDKLYYNNYLLKK
ncbi:MAG: hypothetical protein AB8G11_09285 [Saprospiraceae bacterium]